MSAKISTEDLMKGNKLIAEFMGLQRGKDHAGRSIIKHWQIKGVGYFDDKELKYHSSWDWLMPVVEKIEENHKTVIAISYWGDKHYMNIMTGVGLMRSTLDNPSKFMGVGETKIQAVYSAVTQFITWYNQQT